MSFKLVLVGNSDIGKTSMINRYVYGKFDPNVKTTIGIEFSHMELDQVTKLNIWDTAGQERFKSIMSSLYRGAHAIMFVYDISSRASFEGLDNWWREYRSYGDINKSVAMLVGNKADLERRVSLEEATAWAVGHNMYYEEVSAMNNVNVSAAFSTLVRQLGTLPEVQKVRIAEKKSARQERCCS